MVLSMFDQMLFNLACGHTVVLGRLDKAETWKCETCGMVTDLRFEPYSDRLAGERDTASDIDKRERASGKTVTRAG